MISTNPFAELSLTFPSFLMQLFVILMIVLVIIGTVMDIIHKKNVKYFFQNAKKAKLQAKTEVSTGEKTSIVLKTVAHEILTTSELGAGKRRVAHLLGMYGTIIFWISSVIMIFCYSSTNIVTPTYWPILWHIGALMTCLGGYWFWFFLRVDVAAEAYPWYRIIQFANIKIWDSLFLALFGLSNLVLFGGVYWSKFAHMFYKPGAAIQKNLAEADGSRDNLPLPADKPKQFGLGIKREAPKHY